MALVYLVEGNRDGGDKIPVKQGPCSENLRASSPVFIWKLILHWNICFANLVPDFFLCRSLLKFINTQGEGISCVVLLFWLRDVETYRDLRKMFSKIKFFKLHTNSPIWCTEIRTQPWRACSWPPEDFVVNLMGQHSEWLCKVNFNNCLCFPEFLQWVCRAFILYFMLALDFFSFF